MLPALSQQILSRRLSRVRTRWKGGRPRGQELVGIGAIASIEWRLSELGTMEPSYARSTNEKLVCVILNLAWVTCGARAEWSRRCSARWRPAARVARTQRTLGQPSDHMRPRRAAQFRFVPQRAPARSCKHRSTDAPIGQWCSGCARLAISVFVFVVSR